MKAKETSSKKGNITKTKQLPPLATTTKKQDFLDNMQAL